MQSSLIPQIIFQSVVAMCHIFKSA